MERLKNGFLKVNKLTGDRETILVHSLHSLEQ